MKIYVASSWRNGFQPDVVRFLRELGHEVYDFRDPSSGGPSEAPDRGFSWAEIDPRWEQWSATEYRRQLKTHPASKRGFDADHAALDWCDALVMVQPCGRSAHLELGYAAGTERRTAVYFPEGVSVEPELMVQLADWILIGTEELERWAGGARG